MDSSFVQSLMEATDTMEPSRFGAFLTEDVAFRFGNMPAVFGRSKVETAVSSFFNHIRSIKHSVVQVLTCGNVLMAELTVQFVDRWGRELTVPSCILLTMRDSLISDYRIFTDNHALFVPPVEQGATASLAS